MKRLDVTAENLEVTAREVTAGTSLFDPTIEERARSIIADVREHGDSKLVELAKRFEGAELTTDRLSVSEEECRAACEGVDASLKEAVELASRNIEAFSRHSLRQNWSARNDQGALVGEKFDPFQRVGIYIPGGTAPLISTALMTITLARVAGCPEIAVCTPCGQGGRIHPAMLYAIQSAGASEIYRVGGAQAIAAMALGTERIRSVQKIFGPGNAYVVAAKRLLFGYVAVDLLPGPSELLVIADESADPSFIASDLLAQAEHGSGYERLWLVTTSEQLLEAVKEAIHSQAAPLPRGEMMEQALENNCWLLQVASIELAVELANRIAPEHCEIIAEEAEKVGRGVMNAGALFLGAQSPTALGDYVAGPSHELPTGGAGKAFSGLTADQFQRRTSLAQFDSSSLNASFGALKTLAGLEGLDAHVRSVEIRTDKGEGPVR